MRPLFRAGEIREEDRNSDGHQGESRNGLEPVIELAGLSVRFGKREILKNLSVALSGRIIGLLGPNGAGKSTLIQTLLGFCPASAGTAKIFGHDSRREMRRL